MFPHARCKYGLWNVSNLSDCTGTIDVFIIQRAKTTRTRIRVYSAWMRRRHCDGVKHDALITGHMLMNQIIHTGRAAL